MLCLPHRLVAFVLLLLTLIGLLPVAESVPAVTSAPLAIEAEPTPRIPRPTAAGSSGVPVSEVADLITAHEDRHTAGTLDLTLFDHPRQVTYTAPPVTQEGDGQLTTRLTLPPGPHTSIELDISVTSLGNYQAGARVNVLDHAGIWQTSDPGELVATGAYGTASHHIHVALGSSLDRSAPVEVELACFPYGAGTYPTRKATCAWSNITVYAAVPGWVPNQAKPASRYLVSSVYDHAYASIPPRDGPFLLMESTNSGGGGPATHVHKIQSEQVQFPHVTGPIDLGFYWAKTITGSSSSADGIQILFRPADGSFPTPLVDTGISGSTGWTPATKTLLTDSPEWRALSGKQGWLELRMVSTSIPRAVALDGISFSEHGAPLALLPARTPADQSVGQDPTCQAAQPQAFESDPVNTFSGSLLLLARDLTVPVPGPPLCLRRTYVSLTANPAAFPTSPLGPGWRHAFAGALTFAHQVGGEKHMVIYEAPSGNRLRFAVLDSAGTYDPAPGVYAGLKRIGSPTAGTYTLTTREQHLQRFNAQGQLIEQQDAQGRRQTLHYATDPGTARHNQLAEVRDQSTQRTLTFSYAFVGSQVRLTRVTDQAGRSITYGYDPAARLTRVTDVRGEVTTYTYDGTTALLASETDPLGVTRLRNTYTAGRVTQQVDAAGLETRFAYTPTADGLVTTFTRARAGVTVDQQIDHYRPDGTLRYQERAGQLLTYVTFDRELAPTTVVNGNGVATLLTRSSAGDLTAIMDAAGQTTDVAYNARHQPTQIVGADGVIHELAYDDRGNLIRSTLRAPDGPQLTTISTYTAENRLERQQRPDGVVTRYSYTASGQLIRTIVNEQPDGYDPNQPDRHLVTEYGYDSVGRLITTTVGVGTALVRTDTTSYNADDTIARTIQNYQNGSFDPDHPDEDIITEYGYDVLGRRTFVKDGLGRYEVTSYGPNGQVAETIRNCRDVQGQAVATGCASFAPAYPDRNVATRYAYDALNRTTNITETGILTGTFDLATQQFRAATERATHIEYDQFSRPVTVTRNYQAGQPIYDPTIPTGSPDVNLQELTSYDGAGNPIWQRDALSRWGHTEYDALGRPVRTIANYDDGDPRTTPAWATGSDTDIITEQQYRPDGQLAQQITNRITGAFNPSVPDADRITEYRYDLLGRSTATIENVLAGSTRTDTNRTRTTAYDPQTGRALAQQDALGQWLSYRYDDLSRVTETIQNCRAADGTPNPTDCGDTTKPSERNVRSLTRYDMLGRIVETENALGQINRTDYDGLGRVVATTDNFIPGTPADAATNVTTRTTYDALGRVVTVTDPTGAVTRTDYDALGRAVAVTDAAGRVTRHGYDASSTLRWTLRHDGRLTVFQVDGVGRVVTTIANYQNGIVEAADGVDRDVISTTTYDAAGRRIETADAVGRRTAFRSDLRDQLIQVIENDHAECSTLPVEQQPCNVITTYTYDRAGNRTSITDARNHTRQMSFDAADRQTEERDGLDRATRWEYNRRDQLTSKHDPRGGAYDITYLYDELGRRHITISTMIEVPLIETYDALGRRVEVQDEMGTTTFQYDALHRVTAVQLPNGTVGYGYTPRGERSQLRYPSGATVTYGYTADGQLETVQEGATTLAYYAYDHVGRLAQILRTNGTLTTTTYDKLDRLVALTTHVEAELRSSYQYTLDRTGLRTEVTEAFATTSAGGVPILEQRSVRYRYDGLHRLIEAVETHGTSFRYAYDLVGNRTGVWQNGVPAPTVHYDAANQVEGFSYDAAGNLIHDGTRTLAYDALNHVRSVALVGGSSTSYRYTIDGVLASQTANGMITTTYTQDLAAPLSQVLEQTTNGTTTTYRYGRERLLSEVTAISRTWYGSDALGSVRQTFSHSGSSSAPIHYDPWGTPTQGTPPTFGFTGEVQDATSGLIHLRARWYLPGHGGFASRDPAAGSPEQPYSLHPYQYGYSNPILLTDPSGRCIAETVPLLGDPGCRFFWEYGGRPNLADGGWYLWDVFQGIGSPGAWIADQFTGGNAWDCMWAEPTVGKRLGGTFTAVTVTGGAWKYVAQPVWQWIAGGGSVWQLDPFQRGVQIEQQLGQNLPQNFPVIDRFQNGVATSIKSIDLNAATYQSIPTLNRIVTGYIDKVANYQGQVAPWAGVRILPNQITQRTLELAIPASGGTPAQQAALQALQQYAVRAGVDLRIIPIP